MERAITKKKPSRQSCPIAHTNREVRMFVRMLNVYLSLSLQCDMKMGYYWVQKQMNEPGN